MSDTFLTPAHIHPRIDILGNSQYFNFYDQFNSFVLFNRFTPTSLLNTGINLDFTNTNFSGFRFRHITDVASNVGTFSLNYFQFDDNVGTPLFTANTDNIFFNVFARGNAPLVNNDYTNKFYVDSLVNNLPNQIILQGDIIGNGLVGQSINTSFQKTLNQISNNGNINIGNFLLNNVSTPLSVTDGANRGYVDNKTWTSTQITDFNNAVRSNSLNQFAVPTADLSMNNFKIINLNDPLNNKDAINLSYLQSYVAANKGTGTVTSVTAGTGLSGGTITASGTIALANISGFLAGVYNWPNSLTINQQGQVIGANAGNQPITSIFSNSGLTVNASGGQALINIFDTGVTAGTYTWPAGFSVNSMGQLTFVTSSGSFPINRLAGYPANSSLFLRGDGTWSSQSTPIIDINNGTTGQLNISRLQNYPFNSGVFLRGDGVWANAVTQFPVTVNTSSSSMEVITTYNSNSSAYATGMGFYNQNNNQGVQFGFNNSTNEGYMWSSTPSAIKFGTNNSLRMIIDSSGNITQYDLTTHQSFNGNPCTRFYGTNGAPFYGNMYVRPYANYMSNISKYTMYYANSFCFDMWSSVSGGAAIVMNGQYIQLIQNFSRLGIIFSDYDYDTSSSYQSYIGANGQLYVSSSKEKKYSIREKKNNNYLDRIRKLKVYSYALKCEINSKDKKDCKDRKYYKNKQLHVGLLSEEVKDLFDNCVDIYKSISVDTDNEKDFIKITNEHDPSIPEDEYIKQKEEKRDIYAINYNALMCYLILAIQELADKVNNTRN
jgi:hypothetical protein